MERLKDISLFMVGALLITLNMCGQLAPADNEGNPHHGDPIHEDTGTVFSLNCETQSGVTIASGSIIFYKDGAALSLRKGKVIFSLKSNDLDLTKHLNRIFGASALESDLPMVK